MLRWPAMHVYRLSPRARALIARCCAAGAALAGPTTSRLTAADLSPPPVALDEMVISATRTPQELARVSSSVSSLDLRELQLAQIDELDEALASSPGVIIAASGARGAQRSIYLRGANSHQVLFIVDGVRMNDRSASYFNFLGGADLAGIDRLEVLRGPQSTLYGSSAMGGVILLETARGGEGARGSISGTAGSFDTFGGRIDTRGGDARLGYSASLTHTRTDNDLPRNRFRQTAATGRIDFSATDTVRLGGTVRWQDAEFQEPGSRFFASEADVDPRNTLVTAFAELQARDDLASRLTLGWHRREYRFADAFSVSESRNTRQIADWQNTWRPSSALELVGGANAEWSHYTIAGNRTRDDILAGYLSATARPREDVTLTAGVRRDDFDSVGDATTWRAGAAWLLAGGATKLRATYGTGFSAPGSDDRHGVPLWGQLPNPDLRPEKSRGWDVGVDQALANDRVTVSATYFRNRFRDLFDFEIVDFNTFSGRTINRARASTDGVELAIASSPLDWAHVRASYTYLDAFNDENDQRLVRRPRHTGDVDVRIQPADAWTIGGGVHLVADRRDGGARIEDYTTVRVYGSLAVQRDLLLKLRMENALDERYEEVLGYAALPRGIYGSAEWKF